MKIEANSPEEYINMVPEERKEPMARLRDVIKSNLPEGFEETMSYGMIGYVVPHSIYPDGYHCDASLPLPFMNLASQKNYIAIYHSGIYVSRKMLEWFDEEYQKVRGKKPDMGKSCIRLKKIEDIPYDLIGKLASKMTPSEWISVYETCLKTKK